MDLVIALGHPENIIPKFLDPTTSNTVYVQGEVTFEEVTTEKNVESAILSKGAKLKRVRGNKTLYHPDDLPFNPNLSDMPDVFTPFKEIVEKRCPIRKLLPTFGSSFSSSSNPGPSLPPNIELLYTETCSSTYMPTLQDIGFTDVEASAPPDQRGVMQFTGGEDAALARVRQWMFEGDHLKTYFEDRNGMLGEAYSSKLSPWLALGCISPRWIVAEVKRYEQERRLANKSTYWLVFELIWRDYFQFFCAKYGNEIFKSGGAMRLRRTWSTDAESIRRWKEGRTGVPLIDANMIELAQTGWMSNRGRQNVASYLVLDLGVDWRVGADHFESLLLDHDVCSNYGNWNAAAGLTGGRVNKFNIQKQSKDYDPNGLYIRHWLPELKNIPAPLCFTPHTLTAGELTRYGVELGVTYPRPIPELRPLMGEPIRGRYQALGSSRGGRTAGGRGGTSRPFSGGARR